MKLKQIIAGILILLPFLVVLVMVIIPNTYAQANATTNPIGCKNTTNWFASEALMNGPGVTYDLTRLKQAENVLNVLNSTIYRSHHNSSIGVILSEVNQFQEQGLNIRLQIPTETMLINKRELIINTTQNFKMNDLNLRGGADKNWVLNLLYMPLNATGPPLQIAQIIKEDMNVEVRPLKHETMLGTIIYISIKNTETLDQGTQKDLSDLFDLMGFPMSFNQILKTTEPVSIITETVELRSAVGIAPGFFDWSEVMGTELRWLIRNEVINGLSEIDIEAIKYLARDAWGGHDWKTRYFDGGWVQGIIEEMITEGYTYPSNVMGDCIGFQQDILPAGEVENIIPPNNNLMNMIFGPSLESLAGRLAIVAALILTLFFIVRRSRRKPRKKL